MKALHSWLLTEGAHGMISQVEGLANGLNSTFEHKFIKLSYFSRFLPPILTPKVSSLFNFEELMSGVNSCPDYIISCGRKSVIPNLVIKKYLKEKFNKKVKNIHIQDPKISASNFDYIIVPEHDNKVSGDNIIYSKGALHYLSEKEVLNTNKGDLILSLILGGPNKYYSFSYDELKNIFFYLRNNQDLKKINIVASRRTPQEIFKKLQLEFSEPKFYFDISLKKTNYTKALSEASHLMITCDSTSMISEAATTNKPVYVIKLNSVKNDYRFQRFFDLFKDLGIIRFFDGRIENWTYEKLYESRRVAKVILEN